MNNNPPSLGKPPSKMAGVLYLPGGAMKSISIAYRNWDYWLSCYIEKRNEHLKTQLALAPFFLSLDEEVQRIISNEDHWRSVFYGCTLRLLTLGIYNPAWI